nr:hypothetical protein GCM10020093_001510 [Planobispora longispora]
MRFLEADLLSHHPGHRFDLVFCAETLYYLGRDDRLRRASARLSDLLDPTGLLVVVHPGRRPHGSTAIWRAVRRWSSSASMWTPACTDPSPWPSTKPPGRGENGLQGHG